MNEPAYLADVQNRLHEAGLLRSEERIVLIVGKYVLLEYRTEKAYIYRTVDLDTLNVKRLFSRQKPLNASGYQRTIDKAFLEAMPVRENALPLSANMRAKNLLHYIFRQYFTCTWVGLPGKSNAARIGNAGSFAAKQACAVRGRGWNRKNPCVHIGSHGT